ncbi:MAG: sortase [Firmicutes bacterium]|nr:sortase [Bacillota bacterium]
MKLKKGSIFIIIGLLLLVAALLLTCFNLYDQFRGERSVDNIMDKMILKNREHSLQEGEIPDYILNPDMEMSVETIDGRDFIGTLEIPSLNLNLPIISQWSYGNLRVAPCRYDGSAYKNDMILAAHNYPSHFGNLKYLKEGEYVIFTDADGNKFTYTAVVRETLMPTAVNEMLSKEEDDWDLTLFTCTVGGRSRVVVRCVLW